MERHGCPPLAGTVRKALREVLLGAVGGDLGFASSGHWQSPPNCIKG